MNIDSNKPSKISFIQSAARPVGVEFIDDNPNVDYRAFYGRGDKKFGIYPPGWNSKHGKPPLLGIVYADTEFLAARRACDLGFSPAPSMLPHVEYIGPANKS